MRMQAGLYIILHAFSLCLAGQQHLKQTSVQREVVNNATIPAAVASTEAEISVHALFSNPLLFTYLKILDDGSKFYNMEPEALEEMFWNEVAVAELVHSFGDGVSDTANCGYDLDVAMGSKSNEFYNQWQLQALNATPVDGTNNAFMEYSETNIFHFPPFDDVSAPDMKTSTDRPFYAALNIYRGSGGNPQCGPIAAVLSREYLDDQVLAAPLDTGFYMGSCSQGQLTGKMGNTTMCVCDAWPPESQVLGRTPSSLQHLLQPYLQFYNATQGIEGVGAEGYPSMNLARLLMRLLSRRTYKPLPQTGSTREQDPHVVESIIDNGDKNNKKRITQEVFSTDALPLNFVENTLGYFELNPAMRIRFPGGIKLMVGMYELLWGTAEGDALRQWCISRDWPLAWASNPAMSYFRCGPGGSECVFPTDLAAPGDTANVRLLDPMVLKRVSAGHNITLFREKVEGWERHWREGSADPARMAASWNVLSLEWFPEVGMEPLFHQACLAEACVGVLVESQTCVCPSVPSLPPVDPTP